MEQEKLQSHLAAQAKEKARLEDKQKSKQDMSVLNMPAFVCGFYLHHASAAMYVVYPLTAFPRFLGMAVSIHLRPVVLHGMPMKAMLAYHFHKYCGSTAQFQPFHCQ